MFSAGPVFAQPFDAYATQNVSPDMDRLEQLAAPVALYPDALLAQMLVACTYPDDVRQAAAWLDAGNDPRDIDLQNWDASVKGIARYPQTLHYLADHVDWMNGLGDAFLNQQGDVMDAVQALRSEANAAGNLVSNDKEQVIVDSDAIEIIPADPQIIYVPRYDPQVVYVERHEAWRPAISFDFGVTVGDWLDHDCDWHDRAVYVGSWGRERPWWHVEDRRDLGGGARHDYADNRPGVYRSGNVSVRNYSVSNTLSNRTDVRNRVTNVNNVTNVSNATNVQATRWQHDARKPAPQASVAARPAVERNAYASSRNVTPAYGRQPVASVQSSRSHASVQEAAARSTPSVRTSRPAEVTAARTVSHSAPAPQIHSAAPVRTIAAARPAAAPRPAPVARPAVVARPASSHVARPSAPVHTAPAARPSGSSSAPRQAAAAHGKKG